ncbi:MAG: DNA polymerase III subunit delta [Gemmatimonadaceae bacterium]|jgi:DNA polymerase-3 subunit delta|nr:DNA polymerase III subunit delta [Gemmatimonadaceae bacterium]
MTARDAEKTFARHLKERAFAPAYLVAGDDDYRKELAVRELVRAAVDPATQDFNLDIRRAQELDADAIASLAGTPPMMAERRVVVIRDVTALRKAARAALDRVLASPAPDVVLVLVAAAGAKSDAALERAAFVLALGPLSGDRVPNFVKHAARESGATAITDEAIILLQESVGDDTGALVTEIDKLASYAAGGTIDADAVRAIVGVRRGETVADLLDAVGARDGARAAALVPVVLALPKVTAVQVVMNLTTQTAALGWGAAQRAQGKRLDQIAKEWFGLLKQTGAYPGRSWGDAGTAWTRALPHWTVADADAGLRALLQCDERLKNTRTSSDEQLVATLVLQLCGAGDARRAA